MLITYLAESCGVPVFTIGLGTEIWEDLLVCLATAPTYYFYAPDASDLELIYNEIKSTLCNRYRFVFTSPDAVLSGESHRVEVCAGGPDCTPCDRWDYYEKHPPKIVRISHTVELSTDCQTHGQLFDIIAAIYDASEPLLSEASLFYRITGSESIYNEVPMMDLSTDIYYATIPASLFPAPPPAGAPGVDYYIVATDGHHTVSDPPRDPQEQPYQISICPNEFPAITHIPVTDACPGYDLTIPVEITDAADSISYVTLFYRKGGDVLYDESSMNPMGEDLWTGTIPGSYISEPLGTDYYLVGCDSYGTCSYEGRATKPHHIDPACCPDIDGDGYDICSPGDPGDDGLLADCDDAEPGIHPGAVEICDDWIDNDCDGLIDLYDPDCVSCPYLTYAMDRVAAAIVGDIAALQWLEDHSTFSTDPSEYLAILEGTVGQKGEAREFIALALGSCILDPDVEILAGMVDYMIDSAALLEDYALTVMAWPAPWQAKVWVGQYFINESIGVLDLAMEIFGW